MKDIERAIELLGQGYSLAIVNGDKVFTSKQSGIAALLELAESGDSILRGASAADKIIGKAAAMLFADGGAVCVHGKTVSRAAIEVLENNNITATCDCLIKRIENRNKTGICPMEQTVANICEPSEAKAALRRTLNILRMRKGEHKMKKLGLGMMRLPVLEGNQKKVDKELVKKMIDLFLSRGFEYFDTAYLYHEYTSELVVKECLTSRYPRDCFKLATKLPTFSLKTAEDMPRIFAEQLEKCGVEYFDYYLLHNLNSGTIGTAEKLGAFEFIKGLKESGKIKHYGFSFHDTPELLDKILTAHPDVEFVQLQINYLDWESHGVQSRRCWEVARSHGKEIIVMEPVKGGTLAKLPEKAERLLKQHNPDMSAASWALRFAAGQDGVFMVLSGMSDMAQIEDNTAVMADFKELSQSEREVLDKAVKIIRDTGAIACTACRYCTENCPANIPIPDYFSLYNLEIIENKTRWTPQRAYYENYSRTHGKASDCVKCGACERHCPQHLPIRDWLVKVADKFEN